MTLVTPVAATALTATALAGLHRVTVRDFLAYAEVSDLEHTELIDGVIYDMAPRRFGPR